MNKNKNPQRVSSKLVIILIVIIIIGAALAAWFVLHNRNQQKTNSASQARTTSTVDSAQTDFTSDDATKGSDTTNGIGSSGGITDTNGSAATPTTTETTTSPNGQIVIVSPSKNAVISNGATISGTSSLSKVSYRIIDTQAGMISTGSLNVVDGKFSGTIQFQTKAPSGRLDFFGTQADGNEFENISVPVTFE